MFKILQLCVVELLLMLKSIIDMLSSNSSRVYCIHFHTHPLGKGMNSSPLLTRYGLNSREDWAL